VSATFKSGNQLIPISVWISFVR